MWSEGGRSLSLPTVDTQLRPVPHVLVSWHISWLAGALPHAVD
ncbi:MAG TPA: hypothetical protein VIX73_29780 [Kofleriaceae bacterium]|jgi:hypothetical protein